MRPWRDPEIEPLVCPECGCSKFFLNWDEYVTMPVCSECGHPHEALVSKEDPRYYDLLKQFVEKALSLRDLRKEFL